MRIISKLAVLITIGFISGSACAQEPADQQTDRVKHDKLMAAIQQICPVTGEKLGEHGTPVKVRIGKEEVFLCCKSCAKGKIDARHWATIHANFAKAQGICPVMKKPLPEKAKWTIVGGRIVYVCCPPCTAKLEADPDKFLKIVDDAYTAFLKQKK